MRLAFKNTQIILSKMWKFLYKGNNYPELYDF